uniref:Protein kinase domain-containing protein n=1 Tax=Oryzias latipes TaxID=8090 RepID=A0A3P9LPQ6_ORYLA
MVRLHKVRDAVPQQERGSAKPARAHFYKVRRLPPLPPPPPPPPKTQNTAWAAAISLKNVSKLNCQSNQDRFSADIQRTRFPEKRSLFFQTHSKMCDVQTGHFLMGSLGLYQVGKFLGRGSYGRVAECTKMGSNETFAIKIVDDLRAGSEEMEAMKIIRSLNPDQNNLIKIHECFQYKDYMCLVYEMLDESLEDFIGKRSFHPAHLCQIRAIAQQMLVALSGLESINVLHGDIKPDNIMFVDQITHPLKLKLIDFGLAVNPQELNVGTQMQINPFRAPEVILGLPLDVSVDMWSLAVVLATFTQDVTHQAEMNFLLKMISEVQL